MSGGVNYKWQGTRIAVSIGFTTPAPAPGVTAITKDDPAVVTDAAHGLESGDVIKISGVLGMTEINGRSFAVDVLSVDTFALVDLDSTGYGAYISGGTYDKAAFTNYCQLTGYNRSGGSSPEIDVQTICSTAAEFELGLPDFGTTQLDYMFNLNDTVQQALSAADLSKDTVAVRVTLPKNGGTMVQLGAVQQTSESASQGGVWSGSATIRNSGPRSDVAAV